MRTFSFVLAISLLATALLAPSAAAAHYGPCTHEYFDEVPQYAVHRIRSEGPGSAPDAAYVVAYYCILQWAHLERYVDVSVTVTAL